MVWIVNTTSLINVEEERIYLKLCGHILDISLLVVIYYMYESSF
jgi:hypothetical protein